MSRHVTHHSSIAGEIDGSIISGERRRPPPLFCPKPHRLAHIVGSGELYRPSRWHAIQPAEKFDSRAADMLDAILLKGSDTSFGHVASSPPFFMGSPPARSANPVVHDARFGEDRPVGLAQSPGSPTSPTRKGCGPTKFGFTQAAVRVEGFDCRLDRRDRSNRRITAVA